MSEYSAWYLDTGGFNFLSFSSFAILFLSCSLSIYDLISFLKNLFPLFKRFIFEYICL